MSELFKLETSKKALTKIKEVLEENFIEDIDDDESGFYFNAIILSKEGFEFFIRKEALNNLKEELEKFKYPKYLVSATEYGSGFQFFLDSKYNLLEEEEVLGFGESGPAYNDSDCEEGHNNAKDWVNSILNELKDNYTEDSGICEEV